MLYSKDVYRDLGVVMHGTGPSASSDATVTQNTTNINNYFDSVTTPGDMGNAEKSTLYVPTGYFLINGTIGQNTGVVVPGYNNDQPIRILPPGQQIIMGGGMTYQREFANSTNTRRSSGIMWAGAADQPMIRIGSYGNRILGSLWGYPYLYGNYSAPPFPLCRSGIEIYQLAGYSPAGESDVSGKFCGFDKAIYAPPSASHADHMMFDRLTFRDCNVDIEVNNSQSVNWVINWIEHYTNTRDVHSIVLNMVEGGKIYVNYISCTGNYGFTLLKTQNTSANLGSYFINYFNIDTAIINATRTAGKSYVRLHEHTTSAGFYVVMNGHISFSGGGDPSVADWFNYYDGVNPREPAIKHAAAHSTSWRRMRCDVWGLDYAANNTYRDYEDTHLS